MTVGWTSARAQVKPSLATRARLLRIEDTRHDEPLFLDSLLSGADPVARAWAAMTAGRLGAHSHAASLRRIAVEPDSEAAGNAFFALALLRDTASVGIAAAALHDAPPRSVEAARLLGEVGAAGRDAIITGLADTGVSRLARAALLLSAARLRPVPAAAVSPLLADRDSALAWRAAYVLARGRSAAGARALLSASSSPWAAVREQVARGASKAIVGDSLAAPASAALLVLVRDTSARVRANAVRSLASFGPSARVAVLAALADPDPNVALSAAELLDAVLGDDIADWTRAFDARKIFVVQNAVVVAGARRGKRLDEYGGWAESPDWHRRVATTGHLAQGNPSMVFAEFARKMLDTDGRVRAAATGALAMLVDSAAYRDSTRALLGLRLADRDVQVRTAALSGLAHGATATDLGAALKSFALARRDADGDARLAFWQLVDSALTHQGEGLPDSLDRKLAAIGRPSDPGERAVAARIVRFASWKDAAGTARPLQWYEARAREAMRTAPTLRIQTARGAMELRLFVGDAPLTVYNISSLARRGYFNGQTFHRVVPNFVIQGGDPRGDGTGGPGYAIRDELNRRRYVRGTLGMALSGPNTGGSQFFITHSPQPHLDAGYTVFGELLRGGEVLDRIVQGDRIVRISVH